MSTFLCRLTPLSQLASPPSLLERLAIVCHLRLSQRQRQPSLLERLAQVTHRQTSMSAAKTIRTVAFSMTTRSVRPSVGCLVSLPRPFVRPTRVIRYRTRYKTSTVQMLPVFLSIVYVVMYIASTRSRVQTSKSSRKPTSLRSKSRFP